MEDDYDASFTSNVEASTHRHCPVPHKDHAPKSCITMAVPCNCIHIPRMLTDVRGMRASEKHLRMSGLANTTPGARDTLRICEYADAPALSPSDRTLPQALPQLLAVGAWAEKAMLLAWIRASDRLRQAWTNGADFFRHRAHAYQAARSIPGR
eukprot:6206354-Pleurochrysis_carterae.AAC.4